MPVQSEYIGSQISVIKAALDGCQAQMWTAMPAQIVSFNPANCTAKLQPMIQGRVRNPDGTFLWATLPALVNVPVVFPGGGGFALTFPLKAGDEALVVFSSRCIDYWWVSGKISQQAELRMHSLSDGFAIVGPKSVPNVLSSIDTANVQLRSNDGLTTITLTPTGDAIVNAPGGITLKLFPTISLSITPDGKVSILAPSGLFVNGVEVTVP